MNPKEKGRIPGTPADWINHAKSDLRLAQIASKDKLVRREQVCFHAQQATEKAIKAVLLSRKIEFPFIHDIEELLEIAENNGIALPAEVREAGLLTPYAVESRYPGFWFEIMEGDVDEAIQYAEHTVKWAEEELKSNQGADL